MKTKQNNSFSAKYKTPKQPKAVKVTAQMVAEYAVTRPEFVACGNSKREKVLARAVEYATKDSRPTPYADMVLRHAVTYALQDANADYYEGKPW